LDNQSKQLRNKTNQLAKTTKQWGGMADSARGKLKVCARLPSLEKSRITYGLQEIGDIQNWAELIEHDLLLIEETLRIVHEEDYDQSSGTATS
jgi:hypothetical protein